MPINSGSTNDVHKGPGLDRYGKCNQPHPRDPKRDEERWAVQGERDRKRGVMGRGRRRRGRVEQ